MTIQLPLIDQNYESENIENKTISGGDLPQDIWEPLSAFSNADGGCVRLGIDSNGNRIGVSTNNTEKLQTGLTHLSSRFL